MAVIFDLDGVLVDSEPFWKEAEDSCFAELGAVLRQEHHDAVCGLRIDASVAYLISQFPGLEVDADQLVASIVDRMAELMQEGAEPLDGVLDSVAVLTGLGVRLAVASSSPSRLIRAALRRVGILDCFEVLSSAENESHGKPHPAVYLSAASGLGVDPVTCVAVEDSLHGVVAAKAARMSCIAVIEPESSAYSRCALADRRVASLAEIEADDWKVWVTDRT